MPESVCASGRSPTSSRQRARARSSSARASAIARSSTFATAPYIVSHLSSAFPDRLELTLPGRWVGKPVARVEDSRLLAGQGRYLADLALPGALHAAFVRSPLPHARVLSFDIAAALEVPGVAAVLTAPDLPHAPLEDLLPIEGLAKTPHPAPAAERVRFAGEAVAGGLAGSRH